MTRLLMPLPLLTALAGCATAPPSNPENICAIFREKPDWHDAALKVQKKWGAPVPVPMAMMYQESSFKQDAVPPRYYFLGIIPWGRVSSAYGYAQAKDETWADYKKDAGGWGASRDNFADALDFMGWYMNKTQRQADAGHQAGVLPGRPAEPSGRNPGGCQRPAAARRPLRPVER